jgi:hypothetical protein
MPPRVHKTRGRRRARVALLALGALPAVAVSGYVLAAPGEGPPPAVEDVSPGEARDALERFADAYGSEDPGALQRLLTGDVVRVLPQEVQRGRKAVVAAYEAQFDGNAVEAFDLDDADTTGGPAGRAEAVYTVRRSNAGSFSGRIVLGVVKERGRVRVRMIAASPD